jgi:hypothetical protein
MIMRIVPRATERPFKGACDIHFFQSVSRTRRQAYFLARKVNTKAPNSLSHAVEPISADTRGTFTR